MAGRCCEGDCQDDECPCCGGECDCDDDFDADELGDDPEQDDSRELDLRLQAALYLLQRPRYPGEVVY